MEGMDLWNMFSNDFAESDASNLNENINNDVNNRQVKQEVVHEDEEEEEEEDGENDDEEDIGENEVNNENPTDNNEQMHRVDAGDTSNPGNGTTGDPDDDVIFNFDLRPMKKDDPPVRGMRDFPRTTPSQINATDENGVLINYELGVIYICPACGAEYPAQDQWKAHMNQVHHYNTRRGLNFVRVDKLYHQCLECRKHIAMHSMENLLKHKFTHLPHRCTKCSICMRQYKYRQDLMVHLRMLHRDDVVQMMREGMGNAVGGTSTRHHPHSKYFSSNTGGSRLSITDVKANAIEMFGTDDAIEVRNEPELDTENVDGTSNAYALRSFLDDEASRSSSQLSAKRVGVCDNGVNDDGIAEPSVSGGVGGTGMKDEVCEDYIHYICPQCSQECETQAQWSQHIEFVHDFVSRRGLNFKMIGNQQAQCQECNQLIEPSYMKSLQVHKFSHLPNSEWMRCKLCYQGFNDRKAIQQHLLRRHHLDTVVRTTEDDGSQPAFESIGVDANSNLGDDDQLLEVSVSSGHVGIGRGRGVGPDDKYEPHIDYLCPQCGKVFFEKKMWRKHVMKTHRMNDLSTLNFKYLNDRQLQCNECDKIITNAYGIQNAQQHRITHLPYKAFARCRICRKSYTDRKGLVKHIATRHRIGFEGHGNDFKANNNGQGSLYESLPRTQKIAEPRKEIVTVKNQTYEIVFLDDDDDGGDFTAPDDNGDETVFGESVLGTDADVSSAYGRSSRFKCVDCGSLFHSQQKLQKHISEEHEFLDYQKETTAQQEERPITPPTRLLRSLLKNNDTNATVPATVPSNNSVVERNFIYMCPSCGKEYKTQFDWRRHINEKHNFDKRVYLNMRQIDKCRYQCTQCKDIVCNPKLKGLQDHHFRHLPYRLYLKCLICGTCYNHKPNIMSHLRTRHNISEDTVEGADPMTASMLNATHQAKVPYDATPSGPKSNKPRMLDNTVTIRPPGLNTIEDNISYHNAVDLDFITYYCPKCNKNFDSHAFWRKHIVEVHNYNSREGLNFRQIDNHHYLCLECYKRVTVTHTKGAIGQLQSHKFRHLPYRSFKCLTCNVEFVRKQMFFKHLNRETDRCDCKPIPDTNNKSANDEKDNANKAEDQPEVENAEVAAQVQTDSKPDVNEEPDVVLTAAANDEDDNREELDAVSDTTSIDPTCYALLCPLCGVQFDTKSSWREHINNKHELDKRQSLNLRKLDNSSEDCYQCHVCDEKLLTSKLHLLQLHCFKHMPFGAYIRCQLCSVANFSTMHEMQDHLCQRHPHTMQLPQELGVSDNIFDDGDNSDSHQYGYPIPIPPHLLDDDVEFDDQYLLG